MKRLLSVLLTAGVLMTGCAAKEEEVSREPEVPEELCGSWYEETAGRGSLTITRNEDGTTGAVIDWASSAFETNHWVMEKLSYSPETSTLDYMNGSLTVFSDGKEEVIYTDGDGYFWIKNENTICWMSGRSEEDGIDGTVDYYK